MNKIFISYRHLDSAYVTDRLHVELRKRFGENTVIKDVESIAFGENFVEKIIGSLDEASVLLVVIGSKWFSVRNDEGMRKLDMPDDYVRLEIEAAIESGISIIPILIEDASMPAAYDLPPTIRGLSLRNTAPLRPDPDFDADIKKISDRIAEILYRPSSQPNESTIDTVLDLIKIKSYVRTKAAIKNGEPLFERDSKSIREAGHLGSWGCNLYETMLAIIPSIIVVWTLALFVPQGTIDITFPSGIPEHTKMIATEQLRIMKELKVIVSAMIVPLTLILLAWVASWASLKSTDSTAIKRCKAKHAFLYYDCTHGLAPQALMSLSVSMIVFFKQRSISEPAYWVVIVFVMLLAFGWNYYIFWRKIPKMLFVTNGYSPQIPRSSLLIIFLILAITISAFILLISVMFLVTTISSGDDIPNSLLITVLVTLFVIFAGGYITFHLNRRRQIVIKNKAPWGKYETAMILLGGIGVWTLGISLNILAYFLALGIARISTKIA